MEGGRGGYTYRPALRPGETVSGVIPSMDRALPLAEFSKKIGDDLAARLATSGLFAKEARAMVNTWQTSYFQTEGIRVLFVLPQSWTDAFIPMNIEPQPRKIVRVMVGRLEMLSADRQRRAEAAIARLGSGDSSESRRAYQFLREQGRYVEPIIRHVARTTRDEHVKAICLRLLVTDFVTDLRAIVHNASDGKPLNADPLILRAHLARLLRRWARIPKPVRRRRPSSSRSGRFNCPRGKPSTTPSTPASSRRWHSRPWATIVRLLSPMHGELN